MKATLILANGSIFSGTSIGSAETRVCEMVFNTSMAGYQEILTDPSYAGQGVVMSYPLIGNYGVNSEDNESRKPWVEAFVVRHLSPRGSNFRCEGDLGSYLKEHNITGIQGVDTRALTKILRSEGSMNGMLTCAEHFNIAQVLDELKAYKVENTVPLVTRPEPEVFPAYGEEKYHVAMMDYGVKQHMIECLRKRGCKVTALPASTPAEEVLAGGYDGVMLSNGPGDPKECVGIIAEIKKLYSTDIPIFAICLGHQLMALATGADTYKMKYGHRGGNHPVKCLDTGKIEITSQNHSFAVDIESLEGTPLRLTHVNLLDNTAEGVECPEEKVFSVQYHPESAPGPQDSSYLFDKFIKMMEEHKNA